MPFAVTWMFAAPSEDTDWSQGREGLLGYNEAMNPKGGTVTVGA